MQIVRRVAAALLPGLLLAGLAVGLSCWCIWSLGSLMVLLEPLLSLDSDTVQQLSAVLGQLRTAKLDPPLIGAAVVCCAGNLLAVLFIGGGIRGSLWPLEGQARRRLWITASLWLLLAGPLVLGILWFTNVNDVRLGAVASSLLAMLLAGGLG